LKDFPDLIAEVASSVVMIKAQFPDGSLSVGTGFLIHRSGYIVSALHVVRGATKVEIIPENHKQAIPVKPVKKNEDDMVLLKFDYASLNWDYRMRFAPAKILPVHMGQVVGSEVGILGYAWGMESNASSTLFAFRRTISLNIMHPSHRRGLLYYIDGTAISGMSGGPIFDLETGQVSGVLTHIEPERYDEVLKTVGKAVLPSPEHLCVALQSFYIHSGLESVGEHLE